ncbi:MAG: hypothetical protein Q7S16_05170 [bacterium]|nr:hypothetical protein [bacterium]
MNDKLHHLLQKWGQGQRRMPENNDSEKIRALNTLHIAEQKVAVQSPVRIPWLALTCTGLAVLIFFIQKAPSPTRTAQVASISEGASLKSVSSGFNSVGFSSGLSAQEPSAMQKISRNFADYFQPTPASDTREFLKTDYRTTMKTRNIETLGNRIQTIVRGYGGRIDSASIQTRTAYISFVVPKKTFDAFKAELKTLVPERFMTESIATQNLLPEKRLIEEKTDMMSGLLAEHKKNRDALEAQHHETATALQRQLYGVVAEMKALRAEVTIDPTRQKQIATRLTTLQSDERRINRNLANENMQYNSKRVMLDAQIKDAEDQLTNLDTRDQVLGNTVETVQGSITIDWISIPKIIGLYMPKDWPSLLFLGFGIMAFLSYRRRRMAIKLP